MEKIYKTSDIYIASYLVYNKIPLLRCERSGKKILFCFANISSSVDELIEKLGKKNVKVNLVKYIETIKFLKTFLHSIDSSIDFDIDKK